MSPLLLHEIPFREVEPFKRRLLLLMRTDFYYKITPTAEQLLTKDLQSLSAPPGILGECGEYVQMTERVSYTVFKFVLFTLYSNFGGDGRNGML